MKAIKKLTAGILVVMLVLSMCITGVSAATTSDGTSTMYFKPNTNWTEANARFAAYVWNDSTNAWVSFEDTDADGYYEANIPEGTWSNVIFTRMNPATTGNSWGTAVWNQTADITIPDDKNCFTLADGVWDKGNGEWSSYSVVEPTTATEEETTAVSGLNVSATSNLFPTAEYTYDESKTDSSNVVVKYYFDCAKSVLNAQWVCNYDASLLTLVATNNYMPQVAKSTAAYSSKTAGVVKGNCSDIELYNIDGTVPFIEFEFTVNGTGKTVVDLQVNTLTTSQLDPSTGMSDMAQDEFVVKNGVVNITSTAVKTNTVVDTTATPTEETTVAPTTVAPTTVEETTEAPTTEATTEETTAAPTTEATEATETTVPATSKTIYFVPGQWTTANARMAVYAYSSSNSNAWYTMTANDEGVYSAEIDAKYTKVIFCRMNPAYEVNDWSSKWNQSADQTIPADQNCFTVNAGEWSGANGTWSVYAPIEPTEPTVVTEPSTEATETTVVTEPSTEATETTVATEPSTEVTEPSTEPTTAPVSVFGDINVALTSEDGVVYTGSTDLQIGTYTFKMNVNGTTYCCGSTFNDETRDAVYKSVYKSASTLNSTGGTHTFSYNTSTNKLTITFKAFSLASVFGDINMDLERSSVANVYSGKVTLEAGEYSFRIMNQDVQFCCGYTFNNVTKNSQYRSVYKSASILNADGGTYTFNYDVVTNLLTITYVPFGAKASVIGDISLVLDETETENVYSGTIDLAAGTYQFKMDFAGKTFCKGTTFKDAATGLLYKSVFTSYSNFVATGGTYTFTYNTETNRLSVAKVG